MYLAPQTRNLSISPQLFRIWTSGLEQTWIFLRLIPNNTANTKMSPLLPWKFLRSGTYERRGQQRELIYYG